MCALYVRGKRDYNVQLSVLGQPDIGNRFLSVF